MGIALKTEWIRRVDEPTLMDSIQFHPEQFLFLNIVGTGVFSNDEVIQLSLLDVSGNIVYSSYFKPESALFIKCQHQQFLTHAATWTGEWEKIQLLMFGKTLLVHNPEYDLKLIQQTCQKYRVDLPAHLTILELKTLIKKKTGFHSLEGSMLEHEWKINRSELVVNALLTCFSLLAILFPEHQVFKKKQETETLFKSYCHRRQKAETEGWKWLRQALQLSPSIQSFELFGMRECDFVIQQLSRFIP